MATASVSAYRAWLPAVATVWLALTVATLAFQRRGRRRYGPALLGFAAALLLLSGKFMLDSQVLVGAGLAALLGAVVWRSWFQQRMPDEVCSQCEE